MKKNRNKNRFFKLYKDKEHIMWITIYNESQERDKWVLPYRVRKQNMKKYKKQGVIR